MCLAYLRELPGIYISFGMGLLGQSHLLEVARQVPLEKILVESGSPEGKPRGVHPVNNYDLNHPGLVHRLVEEIARVKGLSARRVAKKMAQNAATIFGINLEQDRMFLGD